MIKHDKILVWRLIIKLVFSMPIILTKLIAGEELIYHANFELNQGYNIEYTLQGQENWQVEGSAGNGLLEGYFNDYGEFGNQA